MTELEQRLEELIGRAVRVEIDGEAHEGLLTGRARDEWGSQIERSDTWVIFIVDAFANTKEVHFRPRDARIVTAI